MALTDTQPVEVAAPMHPTAADIPLASAPRSRNRAVLIQFVQFCLVGALSTALNEGLFNLFWGLGLGRDIAYTLAFALAVTNGFFLNRAWTFRRSRARKMERQYVMFVVINLVGLGLSWAVMRTVGDWLLQTGRIEALMPWFQQVMHRTMPLDRLAYSLGLLVATLPCSVWNFSANKLWTFRGQPS